MFAQPHMLYLLIFCGLAALALYILAKERRRRIYLFLQKDLMPEIAASSSRKYHIWKDVLIAAVLVFSVIALARPQWGFEWQDVRREGLDIFIAIDTSKSMLTDDLKPNRLERAKLAVKDLLKKLRGDRIGLIAFSGNAFLVCPLTVDYGGVQLTLDDLNTSTIPRGGTDIGKAVQEAMKGYQDIQSRYKVVVILTDGENWEGEPAQWARVAAEKNIRIYTVGIGTKDGELVRVLNDSGEYEFVKDADGNYIKSHLNESLLKELAAVTNGVYVRSSGSEFGLDYIYEKHLSHLEKRSIESRVEKKYNEHFEVPLAAALILLIAETFMSVRRRYV